MSGRSMPYASFVTFACAPINTKRPRTCRWKASRKRFAASASRARGSPTVTRSRTSLAHHAVWSACSCRSSLGVVSIDRAPCTRMKGSRERRWSSGRPGRTLPQMSRSKSSAVTPGRLPKSGRSRSRFIAGRPKK
jgi:hypothetical protein